MVTDKDPDSKTSELREWLDREIKRGLCDLYVLSRVLGEDVKTDVLAGIPSSEFGDLLEDVQNRHRGKLSLEREQALANDRELLARVKRHLELLRFAKALSVDIDAVEKWLGTEITVTYRRDFNNLYSPVSLSFLVQKDDVATRVHHFTLGQRAIYLTQHVKSVYVGAQEHSWICDVKLLREKAQGREQACVVFPLHHGSLKIFESGLVFFEKRKL